VNGYGSPVDARKPLGELRRNCDSCARGRPSGDRPFSGGEELAADGQQRPKRKAAESGHLMALSSPSRHSLLATAVSEATAANIDRNAERTTPTCET
jgi:hypothetical protein